MKKIIALVSFIIVILIVISCTQHEQDNPYDITGTKGYHPPSVSAIDKDAAINDTITLQATATDSNGNIALMIWKELNGSWIDSSSTPTIQTVFTTPSVKRIIVMAVDNDGLTASDTFNLTIHLYQPSVKLNSSSLSVNAGDSLTFTALGFDTNGTIAMILWDTGAVFGTKDTTLRVGLMTPGSRKIAVRVKDDDSILSEWDSIKIAINSMPPVISSKSPDTTIIVGDTLTARVNASDNGKIVKYLWARDSINYIDSSDAGAFKTSWTTAGAYVIGVKVRDNSGEYSNQSYIHITVKNAYEKTKNLLPINNEAIITLKPLFAWQPGTYHKTYDLFLDTVNPPVTLHKSAITDTFFTPASDLKYSKTYYWFIKAKDGSLNSDSSPVFKFTTTNNSAPKFIKPANMTVSAIVGTQYIDTLHAADSNGHSLTYKVLSDTSIKFSPTTDSILRWSPQIKDTGTKIFQVMVSDGYNGTDTLAWSVTVTINISKPIISIDNTTSSSAILKWSDSQNATNYRLERGAAKTGPFTTVYTGSDTTFTNNALSPQTTYWYRVIGNTGSFLSVWSDTLGATTMAASTAKNHVFWYNSIAKNYAINDSPGPNLPTGTIRHEGMIMSAQYTQFPGQNGERFAVGNSGNKGRCGILWAKDLMEANGTCSKALVRAEYLDKFAGTPYCEPGTIRVKVGVVDFIGNIESYGLPEDVPSNAVWNDVNGNSISWNMTYNLQSGNLTNEQFIDVVIPQGVTSSSQNAILDKKFMEIDVTSQVNWILSHTGTNKGSSSGQYAIVFLTDPSSSSTAQMHTYSYESSTGKETISPWTQDGNSLHLFVNGDLNFTTPTYLSTPVLGTMTPDTTHIQINWPTVTDATNYKVERSTSASGSFIQIYSGSSNSIVDTNLLPDTEYWYRVRALSTNNLSAWSTVASARTAQLLTKPNFTTDPKDTVIDVGKPLTLRSLATGNPIPRYQWYKNGTLLAGDTLRDMTISNLLTSNSGDYYVVASNSEGTKTSATASVKVKGLLVYYPLDGNASDFSGNG
ncbi:MAG: immunoglobulin domain-containing protein, partial [Fibrobacteres bacterium]|nr:immunoglobulin domain-containing protein [Fibrobacterota bacterium]